MPDDFSKLKRNRSLNSDLNRIRSSGFDYFVTREVDWFNKFYYEMFVPLIQNRHGDRGFLNPYEEMRRVLKDSVLLMVTRDGIPVAGCMITAQNALGRLWILGVKDGSAEYMQEGALPAIYYYSIKYLHSQGCRIIRVGMARSFLNDGILIYKKKWGFRVYGISSAGFYLKVLTATEGVKEMLRGNPFIAKTPAGMEVVSFAGAAENGSRLSKRHLPDGINGVSVYSVSGDGKINQVSRISFSPEADESSADQGDHRL